MQECYIHKKLFHAFCPDCMIMKTSHKQESYETIYGAGHSDSYYPPGAGVGTKDMVNSPSHYIQGSIECIDAIEEVVKHLDGMEAMCTGNAIKYLWRWKHKNGTEDLKKAVWYIQRMIDEFDAN
jgi:hypothetical protein